MGIKLSIGNGIRSLEVFVCSTLVCSPWAADPQSINEIHSLFLEICLLRQVSTLTEKYRDGALTWSFFHRPHWAIQYESRNHGHGYQSRVEFSSYSLPLYLFMPKNWWLENCLLLGYTSISFLQVFKHQIIFLLLKAKFVNHEMVQRIEKCRNEVCTNSCRTWPYYQSSSKPPLENYVLKIEQAV